MNIEQIYSNTFLYSILFLTIIVCLNIKNKTFKLLVKGNKINYYVAITICLIFGLFLGTRPSEGFLFGDSYLYKNTFNLLKENAISNSISASEWVWHSITIYFAHNTTLSVYFTTICFGYFCLTLAASRIATPRNTLTTFLFLLGSLSFYTYAVNGIRNGLACSIVLLIIALILKSKRWLWISIGLAFIALNIHRSTTLPLAALFSSIYIIKNFKWAYTFWILSILISVIAGNYITDFFATLGFDDRLSYLTSNKDADKFSSTGFRWDFLIYSMMPIVLGYYVVIKRGIKDRNYMILLNTYTLANAFWVMVIRASYSNRFAYLSWFMFPLVLAYPLLTLNIWGEKQGKRTAQIMLAQIGFTWFMSTFYW